MVGSALTIYRQLRSDNNSKKPQGKTKKTSTYATERITEGQFNSNKNRHTRNKHLTRSFMDEVRLGQAFDISALNHMVSDWAGDIVRSPDMLMWVSKIREKDNYTSDHCMNVAILAMVFGRSLGANLEEIKRLGISGLLHDIGKMRIPDSILNKEGKLSDEEYQIICQHPKLGREILLSDRTVPSAAIDACYNHHENLDGSGYPNKKKAAGISDVSRIITICDVYDAITSDRIYKKGQTSQAAMKILYNNRGQKFDAQLVEAFIKCIGTYPAGSIVELRSREVGIVISINYKNRHLPKIIIVRGANKRRCTEKVVDLQVLSDSGDFSQLIHSVHPNGIFEIRLEKYIQEGLILQ